MLLLLRVLLAFHQFFPLYPMLVCLTTLISVRVSYSVFLYYKDSCLFPIQRKARLLNIKYIMYS